MSVHTAALTRGDLAESAGADNATATATQAAVGNQTHWILGVSAEYSAAVSLFRTITVKKGSTTLKTFRWDFTNGPFHFSFPVALRGDLGGAVSAELQASGTGGTSGYATVWTALN